MLIRTIAATLTLALVSCALDAQDYAGFPSTRVRMGKPEAIPPDELYPNNRIILKRTDLALMGNGMKISGEVFTDFEADRIPPEKAELPRGQMTGLKVVVELYYWDTVFERDNGTANQRGTGKIKQPQIDRLKQGTLVEGQTTSITISQLQENYGWSRFELPQLNKPLAPGVYRLVASVRLKTQDAKILEAIKWCSDFYGARVEQDRDTLELTYKNVMTNPDLHDEVYRYLTDTISVLKDETLLWIGEVYKDGVVTLVPPDKGTDRAPANYVIWGSHMNIIEQLVNYQNQLDNVDEVVDKELESKLKVQPKSDATQAEIDKLNALKEKWKKDAQEDKKRIKRDNKALIDKLGGRTSKDEDKRLTSCIAARLAVLEQVGKFHEYLTRRYWVLTDGYLQYTGWNSVYNPGYNASDAILSNDQKKASAARKDAYTAAGNAPGGINAKWTAIKDRWKYVPPDLYAAAAAYLKAKEESPAHDAENFTAVANKKVEFDASKWADFRLTFVPDFYEKSNTAFKQVTTTEVYAVQVWPQALSQLVSARDDVIALTYAWEYYMRKEQMKEDAQLIIDGWKRESQTIASVPLANYHNRAKTDPGTLKTRFDGSITAIKSAAKIGDFMSAYSKAVQAQGDKPDPKNLPGVRPPSAPTKEG